MCAEEKLYGDNKLRYGVTKCEDGWIEVRVCHKNKNILKRLKNLRGNPKELLKYKWEGDRAERHMRRVIDEFRSYFESDRVRFIFDDD